MEKLTAYINRKKMSQMELAAHLKISQPYLSQLITGKRSPSLKMARRIRDATGGFVSIEDWF